MRVIKRNGTEAPFDKTKIKAAIEAANREVATEDKVPEELLDKLTGSITGDCQKLNRSVPVEELQDRIVDVLYENGFYAVMKCFLEYRYRHALMRKGNTTDGKLLSLLGCNNEEALEENANKNPVINSTTPETPIDTMCQFGVSFFYTLKALRRNASSFLPLQYVYINNQNWALKAC